MLISDLSTSCCSISNSICILSSSTRRPFATAKRFLQVGSCCCSSWLSKVRCIINASETIFLDLLSWNRLKTSLRWWNRSSKFFMYLILASRWYRYRAIRWKYTKFLIHNRASVKGIIRLAKWFKRVATKTGTITHPCAFISLAPHCVTWLHG